MRLLGHLGWILAPAVAYVLAWTLGAVGPVGQFQAGLAALVVVVVVAAFSGGGALRVGARLLIAVSLTSIAHLLIHGDLEAAAATAWLLLAVGVAASGLAAVGRRLGTPAVPAGAVAACVLWAAMCGLFWADPVSEGLPRHRRRPFRQAVLHADPALALAYDGARFDRLRAQDVYFDVPLASSWVERPEAFPTGAAWLVLGGAAWGATIRRRS